MKNFRNFIIFTKNKFKVLTNRELKLSLNKNAIKSSKFYQNSETKINTISNFLKDKINFLRKKNKNKFIKDFNFISIYYSDKNLMISRNFETKKGIKIEKDISIKIPGDIIDDDKVLNLDSLVKIIQDIISVIGNNQIPLFLILSSKFYKCKTFSKKELSLSKNINTKLISMSPFVEDNTTLRIKDEANIDSQESIKVVFSRKDIIQSWVKVLSKLENPKIGISNGYLELTESFIKLGSEFDSFIIADVNSLTTTLFFKSKNSYLSSSTLPFGSDLYNSESDEIRIQYFNRLQNSIENYIKENDLSKNIKIYICGSGINLLKKKDQSLPNKLVEVDFLLSKNINYENSDISNAHFHNQSYALCQNKNNIAFNFLDNYSKINRWDINKEVNESTNKLIGIDIISKNIKQLLKIILKQKILIYPTSSVIILTLLVWIFTIPSVLTVLRLKKNHLKYQSDINELRMSKIFIEENIDNIISLSTIYRSQSPAYLFANFLQERIPNDVKISNYLLSKTGFRIEFITLDIENANKLIKLLSSTPIIDKNSISIDYIREVASSNGKKVILELNGKLKNLSLNERLKYSLIFEDLGKYTKLNIFKDIENIFGE